MKTVEQTIIEQFRGLDQDAQERVLLQLREEATATPRFDYADWFERVKMLQAEVRATQGDTNVDVVGLLREIREDSE